MWIKLRDGDYMNLQNGFTAGVSMVSHSAQRALPNGKGQWRVWVSTGTGNPAHSIMDGYKTSQEAQGALDEFMSERELVQMSPPVTDEETGTTDEESGK